MVVNSPNTPACNPPPGFPASGKIMETWKMKKTFSRPGKIMEFEKNQPGKIMEFFQWFETL